MNIEISNRQDNLVIDKEIEELVESLIRASLIFEKDSTDYEVSISFVTNEEIRELNRHYRNIDRETDVLSFPTDMPEGLMEETLLGDIIISVDKALEQAKDYNHSVKREIGYLTTHSMFHLMGYDHMEEDEKKIMREKEEAVLKSLNIIRE